MQNSIIQSILSRATGSAKVLNKGMILGFVWLLLNIPPGNAQVLSTLYTGLEQATSLHVGQNAIYIVEQGKHRVLKLNGTGKLLETIGGRGSGDYQFSKPVDIDGTNGLKVYVTDQNNRRVQLFDRRGQYLSSIEGSRSFREQVRYEPTQIAVSAAGDVYFADLSSNVIRHYGLDSNLLDEFRIPAEISKVDDLHLNSREMYILDKETDTIHRLSLNGQYLGFYPADDTEAFYVTAEGIWKAKKGRIILDNRNPDLNDFTYGTSLEPKDLHIHNGVAYILTSDTLYSLPVTQ